MRKRANARRRRGDRAAAAEVKWKLSARRSGASPVASWIFCRGHKPLTELPLASGAGPGGGAEGARHRWREDHHFEMVLRSILDSY